MESSNATRTLLWSCSVHTLRRITCQPKKKLQQLYTVAQLCCSAHVTLRNWWKNSWAQLYQTGAGKTLIFRCVSTSAPLPNQSQRSHTPNKPYVQVLHVDWTSFA